MSDAKKMSHTDAETVNVAHTLAPVFAKQLDGSSVRFGTLWEERTAVLIFLRHFG